MIKIISCFWNVEEYITKCLDSVINQNLKDFKMFLVDDFSDDNTVNLIREKIKDDSFEPRKVKVVDSL